MAFKIGFLTQEENENNNNTEQIQQETIVPRKSLVQVYFPKRGIKCTYYNDQFDLHIGDLVYVDGKLEGLLGRVMSVNYTFKIKLSDYKRVIGLIDTKVHGKFYIAGSHLVTFEHQTLPIEKVRTWFMPPADEEEEVVTGSDDTSFVLEDFKGLKISKEIADRGHEYYLENRVKYICIDGVKGYAIVQGGENYEVEFEYDDGEIRNMTCSCFCSYTCKHEFAAMLQLKDLLEYVLGEYYEDYSNTKYFAAVSKATAFSFIVDNKEKGCITF